MYMWCIFIYVVFLYRFCVFLGQISKKTMWAAYGLIHPRVTVFATETRNGEIGDQKNSRDAISQIPTNFIILAKCFSDDRSKIYICIYTYIVIYIYIFPSHLHVRVTPSFYDPSLFLVSFSSQVEIYVQNYQLVVTLRCVHLVDLSLGI